MHQIGSDNKKGTDPADLLQRGSPLNDKGITIEMKLYI